MFQVFCRDRINVGAHIVMHIIALVPPLVLYGQANLHMQFQCCQRIKQFASTGKENRITNYFEKVFR